MRLSEARQALNRQMDVLDIRRSRIRDLIKEQEKTGAGSFDRVELSKELEGLDKAYEKTFQERERINEVGAAIHNAEASKQQAEAEKEAAEEMMKCLEIFRRIANGDKVPPQDEKKLMDYNSEMYMSAKSMAVMRAGQEGKEWDSLWEEKKEKEEDPDPSELANNAEVDFSMPEMPEVSASEIGG